MKTIVIAGNIGKDAETRQAGSDNVTSFSVAVEDRKGREKSTIWFSVDLWGKRGDALAQYLLKGERVCVAGDLSMREHNGKTYLTVRADQVTLMGGGNRHERQDDRGENRQSTERPRDDVDADTIPF